MAQPGRKAEFFVGPDGVAILKAPALTWGQREAIFERDGDRCKRCGCAVVRFRLWSRWDGPFLGVIDHILPRARGGQNDPENLRLLCESCNSAKGSKTDVEWGINA